jgi:two-component system, OmpR family, response regulator QseB
VRRSGRGDSMLRVGDLIMNLAAHTVSKNGETVSLSGREAAILRALLERAGRVLTRSQLEDALYGWGQGVESNAIEVHIHNLRAKLGAETIKTIRGVGYTIERAAR